MTNIIYTRLPDNIEPVRITAVPHKVICEDGYFITVHGSFVKVFMEVGSGWCEQIGATTNVKRLVSEYFNSKVPIDTSPIVNAVKSRATTPVEVKLPIAELLSQCSATIEELSLNLEECQVQGYPLKHFCNGSQYKAAKARVSLIEQGLLVATDNGIVLSDSGKQQAIGKHSRSPITKKQTILFTDNVKQYIVGSDTHRGKNKGTVPFDVVSPAGLVLTVKNVRSFSKEHGLVPAKLYMLVGRAVDSHRKWVLQ